MSHKLLHIFASVFLALAIAFAGVTPALAAPPLNDNFADAFEITILPFTQTVNTSEATESFEDPSYCGSSPFSVWYSFKSTVAMTIDANTFGSDYDTVLSVWTGPYEALNLIDCNNDFGDLQSRVIVDVNVDTTYYFLVAASGYVDQVNELKFSVQEYVPQPIVADFYYYPEDPSIFDRIYFADNTYDPDWQVSASWFEWNFGDGRSFETEEREWAHQYAMDGDYTVTHTAHMSDGRSASISKVVQVRTHDVAITKILAPVSAKAGQTRSITVYVKSFRYGETVQVALYKSVPGGIEWIGDSLPGAVRSTNRPTAFTFPYTFTDDDAYIGKVTFWAFATIIDARDLISENNQAISSPPTRVTR